MLFSYGQPSWDILLQNTCNYNHIGVKYHTDNFEWSRGFDARFGLAYVDFRTCERLKKDSFHWMQGQIARCKRG